MGSDSMFLSCHGTKNFPHKDEAVKRHPRPVTRAGAVELMPASESLSIEISSTSSSLRPLASSENDVHLVLQSQA